MNIAADIVRTEEINMLEELICQEQFEPADEESSRFLQGAPGNRVRIIYLMNDAVESFLVFCQCSRTGIFDPESEEKPEADLGKTESGYVLVLHQGENVLTLFFSEIQKEIHLYNYARLGHFWVKGYEYIRELEYHLAILNDKKRYLGEASCTEAEKELSALAEFPPLNYCCYPASPPEYVIPSYPRWQVSAKALYEAQKIAEECGDALLQKMIVFYGSHPHRIVAEILAWLFHRNSHKAYVDLLMDKISKASAVYPDRFFEEYSDHEREQEAWERKAELEKEGKKVSIYYEEPFTTSRDSIDFQIHLMVWKAKGGNRVVEIESFKNKTGTV